MTSVPWILLVHFLLFCARSSAVINDNETTISSTTSHFEGNVASPEPETTTTTETSEPANKTHLIRKTVDVFGRRFIEIIEKYQKEANKRLPVDHAIKMSYINFAQDLSDTMEQLVDSTRIIGLQMISSLDLSQDCYRNFFDLVDGIQRQQSWAFKMLDSMGRLPSGFFVGSTSDLGNYDECVDLRVSKDATEYGLVGPSFSGQYCLITLRPKLPKRPSSLRYNQKLFDFYNTSLEGTIFEEYLQSTVKFYSLVDYKIGTCLPSTCSTDEINRFLYKLVKSVQLPVNLISTNCWTSEPSIDMTGLQGFSVGVLGFFASLTLVATLIDLLNTTAFDVYHNSLPRSLLLCFSIKRNSQLFFRKRPTIIRPSSTTKQYSLQAIHGVRVIALIWIIISSNFIFGSVYQSLWLYRNNQRIIDLTRNWFAQIMLNGWLAIDILFVISGILFTNSLLLRLEEFKGKIDIFEIYLHRWIRLLPGMIGALALYQFLLIMDHGPLQFYAESLRTSCATSWWSNILFINNWMSPDNMCGYSFWPLSVHMQLIILAPILLFIIHRNMRLGLRVIISITILSCIASAILTTVYHIKPALTLNHFLDSGLLKKFASITVFPTYQHIPSYCIGLLAGYYQMKLYSESSNYHKITLLTTLIVSGTVSTVLIIIPFTWTDLALDSTIIFFYSLILRPFFAIFTATFLVMCVTNNLVMMNKILSSNRFILLSRLTFTMLLVHLLPIYLNQINTKQIKHWDTMNFVSETLVNFIVTMIFAYFLHITFELPVLAMEMLIKKDENIKNDTKVQTIRRSAAPIPDIEC